MELKIGEKDGTKHLIFGFTHEELKSLKHDKATIDVPGGLITYTDECGIHDLRVMMFFGAKTQEAVESKMRDTVLKHEKTGRKAKKDHETGEEELD